MFKTLFPDLTNVIPTFIFMSRNTISIVTRSYLAMDHNCLLAPCSYLFCFLQQIFPQLSHFFLEVFIYILLLIRQFLFCKLVSTTCFCLKFRGLPTIVLFLFRLTFFQAFLILQVMSVMASASLSDNHSARKVSSRSSLSS